MIHKKPRYLTKHNMYSADYMKFVKYLNAKEKRIKEIAENDGEVYISTLKPFTNTQKRFATFLLKNNIKKEIIKIGNFNEVFMLVSDFIKNSNRNL